MKPGPLPQARCTKEIHLRLPDDEREILNSMGTGRTTDKIQFLIKKEGEKQFPKSKSLLLAKWIETRCEVMRLAKLTSAMRAKLIEHGYTEERLQEIEDEEDQE